MTLSNQSLSDYQSTGENTLDDSEKEQSAEPMREYYQLQQMLLFNTLVVTAIVFVAVWLFYSWHTALNYLLGAVVGMLYLRLLAKEVEILGTPGQRLGMKGLALFAGLIILACTREELQIIPVFLGFITYKAAIIIYTIRLTMLPSSQVK